MGASSNRYQGIIDSLLTRDGIPAPRTEQPSQTLAALLRANNGDLGLGLGALSGSRTALSDAVLAATRRSLTPPPAAPISSIADAVHRFGLGAFNAGIPAAPRYTIDHARKANKQAHDSLLRVLMTTLGAPDKGYDLQCADLDGWTRPEKIIWTATNEGHIPDASAWFGYTRYIFEVETADTLAIEHTRKQCELFAAYANQHGGRFVLYVPAGHEVRARHQLASWRIAGDVW